MVSRIFKNAKLMLSAYFNLKSKRILNQGLVFFVLLFIGISLIGASINSAQAYDFKRESGLSTTGKEAGYNENLTPDPAAIAGQAVQAVLSVLAIVFLAFMIYAGITWITAQGDDQKSMKAKKIIEESITGLIIVIAAYTISYFIINYFTNT